MQTAQSVKRSPALFLSVPFLCGIAWGWHKNFAVWIPLGFLVFLCIKNRRLTFLFLLLATVGTLQIPLRYHLPTKDTPLHGTALLSINSIQKKSSPFQEYWHIHATLSSFISDQTYRNISCTLSLPADTPFPSPQWTYIASGTLTQRAPRQFTWVPAKKASWMRHKKSYNLTHLRFVAKNFVRAYLARHFTHPESRALISALATGEMDNRLITLHFANLGIQHLLAISGFHFSLITLIILCALRLTLPHRRALLSLLVIIFAYFLFIGTSPSCQRAWMMITLALIARLLSLKSNSLNLLGVSLMSTLAIDPTAANHLGFQLSYLSTASILIFFPLMNRLLRYLMPARTLKTVCMMSFFDQHIFILSATIRSALALNGAVHLCAIPTLLYLFGKFPLLSLVYNLFFPFWVGISLFLLTCSVLLSPFPFLPSLLHTLNDRFTASILPITSHVPTFFQYFIRTPPFPLWGILTFLTLIFWVGILLKQHFASRELTESLF